MKEYIQKKDVEIINRCKSGAEFKIRIPYESMDIPTVTDVDICIEFAERLRDRLYEIRTLDNDNLYHVKDAISKTLAEMEQENDNRLP